MTVEEIVRSPKRSGLARRAHGARRTPVSHRRYLTLALWIGAVAWTAGASPQAAGESEDGAMTQHVRGAKEVRFGSGDTVLAGLLRAPAGEPPHPAVVLLPGSLPTAKENQRLAAVAAAFGARGFATLTTDSRGTGGSGGDFAAASFEVLADDAAAAVAMLRLRPDVRGEAVGLWGVSQGATWVGPLAAERSDAAFLVAAAGPLDSPEESMHHLLADRLRRTEGLDDAALQQITATRRAIWGYYATGEGYAAASTTLEALRREPWFGSSGLPAAVRPPGELSTLPAGTRTFLGQKGFDPLAAIGRLRCPMLAVYGSEDRQLRVAEHAEALRQLSSQPDQRVTVEVLPGAGHDLLPVASKDEVESGDIEAYAMMALWAEEQVRATAAEARPAAEPSLAGAASSSSSGPSIRP